MDAHLDNLEDLVACVPAHAEALGDAMSFLNLACC